MASAQAAGSSTAAAMLEEYAALHRTELDRYLAGRDAHFLRRQLYDVAAEYPRRGGRGLRASICMATASAFGARPGIAAKTACAIELMHSAFLIHDDVEDESDERRGAPTLHRLYGAPIAVNAGDALAVMAMQPLFDNARALGPRLAYRILQEMQRMVLESIEGQALELGWRADNAVALTAEDYLTMVLKKTCFYTTIFPCRMGSLIARRHASDLDRFTRFGFFLGAAFQIQDDLLNLVGDAERYGKELNGDLLEGKRTLPLLHALRSVGAAERDELQRILALARTNRAPADVQFMRRCMEEFDSIGYARRVAHGLAGAAGHEFEIAFADASPSRHLDFLRSLPHWVIERA